MKRVALLIGVASGVAAYALTSSRTHSGPLSLPAGNAASIGDEVFVPSSLPTLRGTPGLEKATFARVLVEGADDESIFGHVDGLLVPSADGTLVLQELKGPIAAVLRSEIARIEKKNVPVG